MIQFKNIVPLDLKNGTAAIINLCEMYQGDANANRVGVEVYEYGVAVTPGGTCSGICRRHDGYEVPLSGTVSGNMAYVTLDANCYAVQGPITVLVKLVSGESEVTVAAAFGNVVTSGGDALIQPVEHLPDYAQLLAAIGDMNTATAAAIAATSYIAVVEISSTASEAHPKGTYFIYSGALYKATADIAQGGTIVTSGAGKNCEKRVVGDDLATAVASADFWHARLYYDSALNLDETQPSIVTNIAVGGTVDPDAHGTGSAYFGVIVPCVRGDRFVITGLGGSGVRLWAFVDGEYIMLDKSTADKTLTGETLTAEEDGYLICNFLKNHDHALAKKVPVTGDDFLVAKQKADRAAAVTDAMAYVGTIPLSTNEPSIVTNLDIGNPVDITVHSTGSLFFSKVVPCVAGDMFTITGTGGDGVRLWAFTDEDYTLLSKSTSNKVLDGGTLTAEEDGYLICNFNKNYDYSLTQHKVVNGPNFQALEATALEAEETADEAMEAVEGLRRAGRYLFGYGCSLDYRVTDIPALNAGATPLAYFYGLFDALALAYPEYITKINCDTDAGITPPVEMEGYPIYLYKFVPPYVPKTPGGSVTDTLADVLKVMLIGGTHPEYTAIFDLYQTMRLICEEWDSDENLFALRFTPTFYVFPCQNAWGVANGSRVNYNDVDLNRNMPTANWKESGVGTNTYTGPSAGSEYETQILLHYLDTLKPQIVIDHHNTALGDGAALMYCASGWQLGKDIAADHFLRMSRKWQMQYPETFGNDPTAVYGFVVPETGVGKREMYACEHGMLGITYESQSYLCYSNGGEFDDEHYEHNSAMVETLATDGFLNFLLRCLHAFSVYTAV